MVALTAAHSAEKMAGHWAAKKVVSMVVETAAWRVSQMADCWAGNWVWRTADC